MIGSGLFLRVNASITVITSTNTIKVYSRHNALVQITSMNLTVTTIPCNQALMLMHARLMFFQSHWVLQSASCCKGHHLHTQIQNFQNHCSCSSQNRYHHPSKNLHPALNKLRNFKLNFIFSNGIVLYPLL